MDIGEFVRSIPNFASKSHLERIKAFGWFLHSERRQETFSPLDITKCYRTAHLDEPSNMSVFVKGLAEKKSPELLKDARGFRLTQPVRDQLDRELGKAEMVIVVEKRLADLPGKITDQGERLYLTETLKCYRATAYRAAIVMMWNIAYDHLCRWVLADTQRIAEFNTGILRRKGKTTNITITNRISFEDLKEDEVIDILGYRADFSVNVKNMLKEKLRRRNAYAHPSQLTVDRSQVDDMITDLVNNVVLPFTL